MVEYGNGVGEVAGRANGGGSGGPTMDVGASLSQLVTDSAHTISTLPPAALLGGVVLILVGLMLLRRAF
jgi:hypothetical protein